jgi:L-alanine-DL-glutamate epimerase-like enolase superfamily enzyme
MTPRIERVEVRRLRVKLPVAYKVSNKTMAEFEPVIAEVADSTGRSGFAEVIYSRGYSDETLAEGLASLRAMAPLLPGKSPAEARAALTPLLDRHSHGVALLTSAIEMLEDSPYLRVTQPPRIPILQILHGMDEAALAPEIERRLAEGYRTFKVKVGFVVEDDLARTALIQRLLRGRATFRLDANQAWTAEQGSRFATALDPTGIELFEQPCDKADWDSNAAVAAVSRVPVMLDESIYGLEAIDRAARIQGVGYVKVKLKKQGGLARLAEALERIRALGLRPVLGDGVATDICCWMEACVSRGLIDNAGEMNGFQKLAAPLFRTPMPFRDGAIELPAGFRPELDRDTVEATTEERF